MANSKISEFFSYFFGGEMLKKAFGLFGEIAGEKAVTELKQRLPGFLGLSLEDERIFTGILSQLSKEESILISKFLNACEDYERNRFRNVVAGIPSDVSQQIDQEKKERKILINDHALAVKFLKNLAEIIKENGPKKAKELCLAGGIIIDDPVSQRALRVWRESVAWFKATFLDFFGISCLSELSLEKIDKKAFGWAYKDSKKLSLAKWAKRHEKKTRIRKIFWK